MDAAEVVAKNPNVYADLSGLVVGDRQKFDRFLNEPLHGSLQKSSSLRRQL